MNCDFYICFVTWPRIEDDETQIYLLEGRQLLVGIPGGIS